MAGSDDGLMLNLTPYAFDVEKKKKKPQLSDNKFKKISVSKSSKQTHVEHEGRITHHNTAKSNNSKRKYIDPKDFTPISTLFNKNPEIPSLPEPSLVSKSKAVVFSVESVQDLPVSVRLKNNLRDQFKFTMLTKIQKLALPDLLEGKDMMIKSPTGSGKTMCYSVPIMEHLSSFTTPIRRIDGPYAVILVPTRELALQTLNIIQDLCKSCISIVPGMLIGGEKCKSEKARLRKGINILIATPGRLHYHLRETSSLNISKVCYLVLDEADKLLDMGFEKTLTDIVGMFDEQSKVHRQSILLSATLNVFIKNLAALSLKDPVFVDASGEKEKKKLNESIDDEFVVPSSLTQYFVTVPAKLRLIMLMCFLATKAFLNELKEKVIVFVSNKNSVKFSIAVAKLILPEFHKKLDIKKLFLLHGDMTQQERFKMFESFKKSDDGVLFCTDVGARGLDIKKVDWIVQYSCPTQIEDYLHRVGRTARIGEQGKSLLFVLPSEVKYIALLEDSAVTVRETKMSDILKAPFDKLSQRRIEERATELQNRIEEMVLESKELESKAVSAYRSFIQSYATYPTSQKHIFHVKNLHLGHVAKSFALRQAPNKFVIGVSTQSTDLKRKADIAKKSSIKKMKLQKCLELGDEIVSGPMCEKVKFVAKSKNQAKQKKRRKIRI